MTMRETEDGDIHRHGLVLSSKIPDAFRKDFEDRKETKGRLRLHRFGVSPERDCQFARAGCPKPRDAQAIFILSLCPL
jgi:hypothetical protein